MAEILITSIQVKLCFQVQVKHGEDTTNSSELLLLNFFDISLPSQPLLVTTCDFTTFPNSILQGCILFTAGLFWFRSNLLPYMAIKSSMNCQISPVVPLIFMLSSYN